LYYQMRESNLGENYERKENSIISWCW
jgi:hypothetical protein